MKELFKTDIIGKLSQRNLVKLLGSFYLAPLLLRLELINTYREQNKHLVEVRLISYIFAFYNFVIFYALEVM